MRKRRETVATPGEWQCGWRRLAVANGPTIFQMLLVKQINKQEGLAVASIERDDPSTLPGDDPFYRARMHRNAR